MEGKIDMAARRQVTNKLRQAYAKASKKDKGVILSEVIATTGMGRSTARRMLSGPRLPAPKEQVDQRTLRARTYSDESRALLEHVWALMGMPCGKYLLVMLESWLLDVHVKRLRAKIEPDPGQPRFIVTVRGLGSYGQVVTWMRCSPLPRLRSSFAR